MKKAMIAGGAALLVLIIGFVWLLSAASSDNAPQDIKVIDIPDTGDT